MTTFQIFKECYFISPQSSKGEMCPDCSIFSYTAWYGQGYRQLFVSSNASFPCILSVDWASLLRYVGIQGISLEQPFSMGPYGPLAGPGTFEGGHRLEAILSTPSYKVCYATYTILIRPILLSDCVYGHGQKKVENDCPR